MPQRYHSLDFLRAAAMFLGILLHALIPFMANAVPFWAAHDDERSPVADLTVFIIHAFRMQVFFLLAGSFGCLLYERYGLGGMLKHRFVRIVIPFGLAVILIGPTLQAIWLYGDPEAVRFLVSDIDTSRPRYETLIEMLLSGRFLTCLPLAHLWFLYYLIFLFALMVPFLLASRAVAKTPLGKRLINAFRRLLALPGRSLLLAIPTTLLLLPMKVWGFPDTPMGWTPSIPIIAYYFLFFAFGWLLWTQRDLLSAFTSNWGLALLIGNLLVLPAVLNLFFLAMPGLLGKEPLPGLEYQFGIEFLSSLYTWLMIGGLMGLFQFCFSRERRWVRYASDASYWCYLWHLSLIVPLQIVLAHAPLPGMVKFTLIVGLPVTLLLFSYEYCVRYTAIGALLNGRKKRADSSPTVAETTRESP